MEKLARSFLHKYTRTNRTYNLYFLAMSFLFLVLNIYSQNFNKEAIKTITNLEGDMFLRTTTGDFFTEESVRIRTSIFYAVFSASDVHQLQINRHRLIFTNYINTTYFLKQKISLIRSLVYTSNASKIFRSKIYNFKLDTLGSSGKTLAVSDCLELKIAATVNT